MPFPVSHPALLRALEQRGYAEPTPVQAAVLEPRIDVTLHPEPVVRPRPGAVSPRTLASPPDAPPPRL